MSDSLSAVPPAVARASTANAVSIAVAAKALDQARDQGDAVNQLIRSAGEVQKAAARAPAHDGAIDRYA